MTTFSPALTRTQLRSAKRRLYSEPNGKRYISSGSPVDNAQIVRRNRRRPHSHAELSNANAKRLQS